MKKITTAVALLMALPLTAIAQGFENVTITQQPVSKSVHMLQGAGGNIGVSAGPEGILMIDDQFAPLADKIAASLKKITNSQIRYIVNTHHHGDHTGSNEHFAKNTNAVIAAHENVRRLMSVKAGKDSKALPTLTYADGIKIFINGETVNIRHLPKGHTAGDSYVFFEEAKVVHTGDLFFESRFPYIDLRSGGSVNGYIASVEKILADTPDDVAIIPGHGKLTNKAGYTSFLNMIKETQAFVLKHKKAGKSDKQIIAMGLPDKWKSWSWQFIDEAKWIKTLYQ